MNQTTPPVPSDSSDRPDVVARHPIRIAATVVAISWTALASIGLAAGQASSAAETSTAAPTDSPAAGSALTVLATLEVKGRAAKTGYERDAFGPAWADSDRNGCDTRNDILRRDLVEIVDKPGTNGCVVPSGTLTDPYSGTSMTFVRGQGTSTKVQIDHVVSLSNSWQTGSRYWDAGTRLTFANDPLNLLAVDGPLNQQKGDGDAATWLPPNKDYRCMYVARQVAVKAKYGLWVTSPERDAIARILSACPSEPVPSSDTMTRTSSTPAQPSAVVPSAATAAPATPVVPDVPGPAVVTFANCTAVRAAGAAPLLAGQPGYAATLDRDGDGIACE